MHAHTPGQIIDTPNSHGMFMLGTTSLYLCHMPMFTKEDHRYQVTLKAHLDPASMATFVADKAKNPAAVYNLSNLESDLFILPDLANGTVTQYQAAIYRGYSNAGGGTPGPVIVDSATVFVERVVRLRAFMDGVPRPAQLTYVLFGDANGVYLDHYITQDPDFQHLLTLAETPAWLAAGQIEAGVEVAFVDLPSLPIGCQSPLGVGDLPVAYEGRADAVQPVRLASGATIWYSTGNMLNVTDPCPESGQ